MFFILSKILSFLLSPIWWIIVLLLLYIIFGQYRRKKYFLIVAFSSLLVFSNPFLFYHVSGWWEGDLINPDNIEHYDGLILLGGFSSYQDSSQRIRFNESADRLFQALELYNKGKADYFIFTGGSARILREEKEEGVYLSDYLKLIGLPDDRLLVESISRNTHENAVETYRMLKDKGMDGKRFLLVTSGFHMKRAVGCFKKEGMDVEPYATDPLQSIFKPDFGDAITPSASVLARWERLYREWVGYVVYRIKGFV